MQDYCDLVAAGTGPVALDAERASGYRYSQRAYLVQVRRAGAGTAVIDPLDLPGLGALDRAIGPAEWVLHAASQDLPCLAELGMRPQRLFDTELAGRLLGYPRVGLATLLEHTLDSTLAKGYSAANWSTRPLPEEWIAYAALDVELLLELRDHLAGELVAAGKQEWAEQEFAHLRSAGPPAPRPDPWRRTSGIHVIHGRRNLATVRALWEARDEIARDRDIAPGRILPDRAIVEAARVLPSARGDLVALSGYRRNRDVTAWWRAIRATRDLPDTELPTVARPIDQLPPPNRWRDRSPEAATRLAGARAALAEISARVHTPVENLVPPEAVRRLAWSPPDPIDVDGVRRALVDRAARRWQVDVTAQALTTAIAQA